MAYDPDLERVYRPGAVVEVGRSHRRCVFRGDTVV